MNPIHTPRRRQRGVTMIELIISQAIMAVLMGSLIYLFVSLISQEKSNLQRLNMAFQAAALHRELRSIAAIQGTIDPNQDFVIFSSRRGGETRVSRLEYVDGDGDPDTIIDNEVRLVRNVNDDEAQGATVVRFVSPLRNPATGEAQPIFTRTSGSPAPLIVRFRIGDRTRVANRREDEAARQDDAATGRGFQSMVFSGAYAPRAD